MSRTLLRTLLGSCAALVAASFAPAVTHGQSLQNEASSRRGSDTTDEDESLPRVSFKSRGDSLAWARNRALAARATGFRLVVSLQDRHLWAIIGRDTVLSAPVAVAKG